MQTHSQMMTPWHLTLAQEGGANPVFSGASPSTPSTPPAGGTGTPPPAGARPGSGLDMFLPLLLVIMVILIFSTITGRRQEKKRRELLSSIKKYDKVVTVGGLIGTVVELRDDEVVLKVDDHSSTKIRFTRSAIQHVLRPPGEAPAGKGGEKDAEAGAKGESVGAKN